MCSIPIALTIASTAMQAYSQQQAGKQAQMTANYNAEINNRNAEAADKAALDATQRGADEAAQVKERARRIAASQRAGAAGGGVSVDSGSALDLLTETAGMGELDALTTLNNAQREAYGFKSQATNQRMQAGAQKLQGDQAASAGKSQAFGTILTGGYKAYSQWDELQKQKQKPIENVKITAGGGGFAWD
jgi:hypothetical protein